MWEFSTRKLADWLRIVHYCITKRINKCVKYLEWLLMSIRSHIKCINPFQRFSNRLKSEWFRCKTLINCIRKIDNRNSFRQKQSREKVCATFLTMHLTSVLKYYLSVLLCNVICRELMYKVLHFLVLFHISKGWNFNWKPLALFVSAAPAIKQVKDN